VIIRMTNFYEYPNCENRKLLRSARPAKRLCRKTFRFIISCRDTSTGCNNVHFYAI